MQEKPKLQYLNTFMSIFSFIKTSPNSENNEKVFFKDIFELIFEMNFFNLQFSILQGINLFWKYSEEKNNLTFEEFIPFIKEIINIKYKDPTTAESDFFVDLNKTIEQHPHRYLKL